MATGDNSAHAITGKEIQLYQPQGFSDLGLDRDRVNEHDDVPSPTPISQIRQPETGNEEIETPESSRGQSSNTGQHQTVSGTVEEQETSARKPSTKKQRILIRSRVLGTKDVYFRVFKFPGNEEQYVLEMHAVQTGAIDRYRVEVGKVEAMDQEKWGIKVYDLETGQHIVFPMIEDSNRPKFLKKYHLSLQERLERWTIEKRVRINSGKAETFYRHWSRTFRSLLEVSGFILYSCEPKDLRAIHQEEEAVDAIMQISSAEAGSSAHDNLDGATNMEEGSENVSTK